VQDLAAALKREFDPHDMKIISDSIRCMQNSDSRRSLLLNLAGDAYMTQYEASQNLDDLNQAVQLYGNATEDALWNSPQLKIFLNNYGTSLLTRYRRLWNVADMNEAILRFQEGVRLTPEGNSTLLNNLAGSLLTRFEIYRNVSDIDEAIHMFQDAIRLTPDNHPDKPGMLNNLGNSLARRFERLGNDSDVNESVLRTHEAVQLTPDGHSNKPMRLMNLGNALAKRFQQFGNLGDINEAILKTQSAIRLAPDGQPDKPSWLSNLGAFLLLRFDRLGDTSDIDESVLRSQDAVKLSPDGDRNKPTFLMNLGNSLLARFQGLGDVSDINESVLNSREGVSLTPEGDPDRPLKLTGLGNSLARRFERLGNVSDINESILKFREAVQLIPDGHPNKASAMHNLGLSLLNRFDRLGNFSDIDESVLRIQDALRLTPKGHPEIPSRLNNLGNSLLARFELRGEASDINESIVKYQNAVQLTPDGHPDKPTWLSNLGNSLSKRFAKLGGVGDAEEAILELENAVRLTPDGHPDRPLRLNNLGNSLITRFGRLMDVTDLNEAILKFRDAANATYGAPSHRFKAAIVWSMCLQFLRSSDASILEPFSISISMLPEIASLGTSLADRHYAIRHAGHIACEAAAAAIKAGEPALAAEWLEQGRSITWGQLLHLRAPLDELRKAHSDYAQRLQLNSYRLESASFPPDITPIRLLGEDNGKPPARSLEDIAQRGYHLAQEREKLLAEIRRLKGFERFLLPKLISELTPAASSGPVVTLSLSKIHNTCFAQILLPGLHSEALTVELGLFPPGRAERAYKDLQGILSTSGRVLSHESIDRTSNFAGRRNGFEDGPDKVLKDLLTKGSRTNISKTKGERDGGLYQRVGKGQRTLEAILAELWECVGKVVLDALAIQVCCFISDSRRLLTNTLAAFHKDQTTTLVVSNWNFLLLAHSRCRYTFQRCANRFKAVGLRYILLHTDGDSSFGSEGTPFGAIHQTTTPCCCTASIARLARYIRYRGRN
jgi:tetratricopeptide (TPR) repeat protein